MTLLNFLLCEKPSYSLTCKEKFRLVWSPAECKDVNGFKMSFSLLLEKPDPIDEWNNTELERLPLMFCAHFQYLIQWNILVVSIFHLYSKWKNKQTKKKKGWKSKGRSHVDANAQKLVDIFDSHDGKCCRPVSIFSPIHPSQLFCIQLKSSKNRTKNVASHTRVGVNQPSHTTLVKSPK